MKTKTLVIAAFALATVACAGLVLAQPARFVKKETSGPLVFRGAAATPPAPTIAKRKVVPPPSTLEQVARASKATGLPLTAPATDYTFSLTPAHPKASGKRGWVSFLTPAMVLTDPDEGWAMLNSSSLNIRLNVPPNAGKLLQVDVNLDSAGTTNVSIVGMGASQTVQVTSDGKRVTLLALMPVANDVAYWTVSRASGDSWYFSSIDVTTIK